MKPFHHLFTLLLFIKFSNAHQCGYQSCHPVKDNQVNLHLVPHSHDDLGYVKTYEQYFYGSNDTLTPPGAGVQYILDSVIEALQKDTNRRFIYVETGFFWKWWLQQDKDTQNQVKSLVNNGQLEFIGGGWSMNDEATTYYQTTIDQLTWGLKKLNETFGECGRPKVAWQIDPFGHSREMASIFAQLGFDGFFLNRIDYQDHANRASNHSLEFVWRGSPDHLGESSDIYTNVLFRHYSAPKGLCFDVRCTDEPVVDDPQSPEYNVELKARDFINNWVVPALQGYASSNILVPMGEDFQYQYAGKYFKNIDKLIKYINAKDFNGTKYNLLYSTPSCYLKAVHEATKGALKAPLKTDDFFPYASSAHNYWTGYFTSRPTGKAYSRQANNFLQICKQLSVLANSTSAKLDFLRESLATFQHHDGITGTEREPVAHDYIRMMHHGITQCEEITNEALSKLVHAKQMTFTTCPLLNISQCARTENEDSLVITVYNPLGKYVNKFIRLPVKDNVTKITVTDPDGVQLVTQLVPIHPAVLAIPGRNSTAQFELIFRAQNIPPLGYKSYFYNKLGDKNEAIIQSTVMPHFNKITKTSKNGLKLSVGISYYYYTGSIDQDSPSQNYVFRPDPTVPLKNIYPQDFIMYQGPILSETHWFMNDWLSYCSRHYNSDAYSEFTYLVGPLPYKNQGLEPIVRFNTDLEYDDTIYTDTNGRETIQRTRNYRATWDVNITEPESGNYYPVVSQVSVKNGSLAGVSVVSDRAQGAASLNYQKIEFMIHRNTINTTKGLGEPLNEQEFGTGAVTRGSHYLVFTGSEYVSFKDLTPKEVAQQVSLDSWIFFASPNGLSFDQYKKSHVMKYSGLSEVTLPRNVHILTLEPWGPSQVLLRLENFIGKDDSWHSGTSTVNIQGLFSAFKIVSARETTLGANQWLDENSRIRFDNFKANNDVLKDFSVTLKPMQIRTFIVTITYQ